MATPTYAAAMIAEGVRRVADLLFDGVKRSHYVGLIMGEKGTPKGFPETLYLRILQFLEGKPERHHGKNPEVQLEYQDHRS